ncbi:TPA: hypothetical protein ACH3X1_008327 [Trebouxia sp. C0004]
MFRSLALYAFIGARRRSHGLGPVKSDQASMLAILNHQYTPRWPELCSRHRLESNTQQAAVTQSLTGFIGTLVGFQVKSVGTVSGTTSSITSQTSPDSKSHAGWDDISNIPNHDSSSSSGGSRPDNSSSSSRSDDSSSSASASTDSAAEFTVSSNGASAAANLEPVPSSVVKSSTQAAKQLLQQMEAASRRKDHASVKQLFDPRLAQQAATGVAVGMHIYMFKAHAGLGEGLQAVALMKDMRAVGLPVPAPACSLLVLAFCKADALQDALLHLQCTLPPERVDTFMVNGILIAATQSRQPQLLVLHQCLDILQERGLAWNATTWRQVFRLQAKGNNLDGIQCLKAELDSSSLKNDPEVLTAYVRALCDCNQLQLASHALHHLLQIITPPSPPDAPTTAAWPPGPDDSSSSSALRQASQAALGNTSWTMQQPVAADAHLQQMQKPQQPSVPSSSQQAQYLPHSADRPSWRGWVDAALDAPQSLLSSDKASASVSANQLAGSSLQEGPSEPSPEGHIAAAPLQEPSAERPTPPHHSLSLQSKPSPHVTTQWQGQQSLPEPIFSQQSEIQFPLCHQRHSQHHSPKLESAAQSAAQSAVTVVPPKPEAAGRGSPPKQQLGVAAGDLSKQIPALSRDKLRLIREACHVVMTLAEQQGCPEILLPVLEGMQQAGVESDTAIQNSEMRLAKQQGQSPAQLEQYLIRLHRLGLKPDEQTYNILLRAYAEHGDLKAAAEILDRMGADGILPGRYTFNALLQAHSAVGDAQGAANVYDTMKDHGIKADHCTFIALFMAIKNQSDAARSQADSGLAGWLDKHQRYAHREASSHLLHEWVADMKAAGLKHIGPSLTALVQAYGHTMDFTRMVHLLRASWSAPSSAKPNLLTYNAAISVCSKVGQLGRAIRLLHEMRAAGIAPDVRTYTSLISACGFSREPRMAIQLWSEMHKQGIKPSEWTYTAKAKVESSVGAFDDALRTTQQMQADGITPSKGTWRVIVSMAEQMGRPDVVRQVQNQAKVSTPAYAAATAAGQYLGTAHVPAAASPQGRSSGIDLEDARADDLEDGGWSSGFDDTDDDDDLMGGPF